MNRSCRILTTLIVALTLSTSHVYGQERPGPLVLELARAVLVDPTTYAAAVITYEAESSDWRTSQVLFAHGWFESNPRFTVSGRPNDWPLSFGDGQDRIRRDAFAVLGGSMLNNLGVGVAERWLIARHPGHRRLIRAFSWGERFVYASLVIRRAGVHVRQANANRRLARELGYLPP